MIDEYVKWLIGVYAERTGVRAADPDTLQRAIRTVFWHKSRWPGEEDFVSLVAAEIADQLNQWVPGSGQKKIEPFLKMVNRVADTVRHRIARQAHRQIYNRSADLLEQVAVPDPPPTELSRAFAKELAAGFSLEEQAILEMYMDGMPVAQLARELNVSVRTVHRRLNDVKARLASIIDH